jgi:HK97 family phage major capsid protein
MTVTVSAPETKAGVPEAGAAEAFETMMGAFEAFREVNDRRLDEIERRSGADVVTVETLGRIEAALDEQKRRLDGFALKAARPGLGAPRETADGAARERKAAFETYVRTGREDAVQRLEAKALSVGSPADGGYLVPDETEREIMRRLSDISPIRRIAGSRQVSASVYRKPFSVAGPAVGWVAETASRPQTASPTLAELSYPTMELYAMPAATGQLLDDAAVDVDRWIAEEVEAAFAEQEGAAFVSGDGTNKPKGFLAEDTVADASWAWGELGYVLTGASGALPASNPSDVLIDLVYALKAGYRQNAHFVMNRKTQAAVRKLKDADGNYLWQPPATAGAEASLMNFPVAEAEDMPNIAANSLSIAFGDFKRGYLVVDRLGVRVLRDPYSAKPYVLFYTTKRVGGGVQDYAAIKLLKFGTS